MTKNPIIKRFLEEHGDDMYRCSLCYEYKPARDFNVKINHTKQGDHISLCRCKACANFESKQSHGIRRARLADEREKKRKMD